MSTASRLARSRFALPIAAALALLVGYADLVRGGVTLGPLLLAVAYVGLIPAALLRWRRVGE